MSTAHAFEHVDLTGLNRVPMLDAPTVTTATDIKRAMTASEAPLSIAGMRHSQGGHTAVRGGRMLLTETFNQIEFPDGRTSGKQWPDTVWVDAGITWSEIHRHVCARARTPRVQQSSAHFSVGGSLSVNCHGREVRWGPVSDTVEEITLLTGAGDMVTASATVNTDLFRAALGGYGACGMILRAKLRLTPNFMMSRYWDPLQLDAYQGVLRQIDNGSFSTSELPQRGELHLHHGWLNVSRKGYLSEVLSYTVRKNKPVQGKEDGSPVFRAQLRQEAWGTSEMMRAGWSAARQDPNFRESIWKRLSTPSKSPRATGPLSRVDYLREEITFTSSKGDAEGVDLLQEYFVPLDQLVEFLDRLKRILPYDSSESEIVLLSCTVRYVRGDSAPAPFLSYGRGQARASVAIDAHVKRQANGDPSDAAAGRFREVIDAAITLGGTFYLPYHRFAQREQLEAGYPGLADWLEVVGRHNPTRRFHNAFLNHYGL